MDQLRLRLALLRDQEEQLRNELRELEEQHEAAAPVDKFKLDRDINKKRRDITKAVNEIAGLQREIDLEDERVRRAEEEQARAAEEEAERVRAEAAAEQLRAEQARVAEEERARAEAAAEQLNAERRRREGEAERERAAADAARRQAEDPNLIVVEQVENIVIRDPDQEVDQFQDANEEVADDRRDEPADPLEANMDQDRENAQVQDEAARHGQPQPPPPDAHPQAGDGNADPAGAGAGGPNVGGPGGIGGEQPGDPNVDAAGAAGAAGGADAAGPGAVPAVDPAVIAAAVAAAMAALGRGGAEPAGAQRREKVKIGLFSEDDPQAWKIFKRRVNEAKKLNQWTDADAKSQVKIAITGDAAAASQDIDVGEDQNALDAAGNPHPRRKTFEAYMRELELRFVPESESKLAMAQFRSIKQMPGETISQFASRIRTKANIAWPNRDVETDQEVIRQFIMFLNDAVLVQYLQDQDPQTFPDAIRLAQTKMGNMLHFQAVTKPSLRRINAINFDYGSRTPTTAEANRMLRAGGRLADQLPALAGGVGAQKPNYQGPRRRERRRERRGQGRGPPAQRQPQAANQRGGQPYQQGNRQQAGGRRQDGRQGRPPQQLRYRINAMGVTEIVDEEPSDTQREEEAHLLHGGQDPLYDDNEEGN